LEVWEGGNNRLWAPWGNKGSDNVQWFELFKGIQKCGNISNDLTLND
jgi:hypothetical protein